MILLTDRTTDGSGTSQFVQVISPFVTPSWHAYCWGTFDGATVTIEISPDEDYVSDANSNWFPVTSGAFTAKSNLFFNARFRKIRGTVSNDGAGTSVSLEVV